LNGVTPRHFFTVDVEEYFHVSALESTVSRADWEVLPSRVDGSVDLLLDLLARHDAHGTFFVLGWLARRRPAIVRRIADAGHEIASHSFWHRRVSRISRDEFRAEARDSKAALEDVVGAPVYGFRAPTFSIRPGLEWAFDILLEEGYRYDSSLFPIRRPDYGYPGAPAAPHLIRRGAGVLLELPLATTTMFAIRVPAAGGAYLRQLPYALVRRAFREHTDRGLPGMFYIHPWELDPGQPHLPAPIVSRLRHYRGLARTQPRLERLLAEFRFTSVARHFGITAAQPVEALWAAIPA
jgi:polysaccharide deacetylase family protein (PEP-CTERM system associated)